MTRLGIEPSTSSVLRTRHYQLDHQANLFYEGSKADNGIRKLTLDREVFTRNQAYSASQVGWETGCSRVRRDFRSASARQGLGDIRGLCPRPTKGFNPLHLEKQVSLLVQEAISNSLTVTNDTDRASQSSEKSALSCQRKNNGKRIRR